MFHIQPDVLTLALIGLVFVIFVMVFALLIITQRRVNDFRYDISDLRYRVDDALRDIENAQINQGMAQREELLRGMHAVNDSLLSTLSSGYQAQSTQLIRNENRMDKLREALEGGMRRMQAENGQKLEEMRKTVDEKLHETLDKRLGESFSQVSRRLEQVYAQLGEMRTLATGVDDLKRVLSNVKTRGIWGEMQLESLLSQALTSAQYAKNVAVRPESQERVEFAVCLPGREGDGGRPVYLPLDSKFPQEDYARLVDACEKGDAKAVEAAQKALLNTVTIEAKRIGKYIEPPYTTDFAVMFLPLEGLYAEVMRHAEVAERLQREQRIVLSGPSTLLALLNSLQMGFRTLAIEQRSAEVWKLLGAVKADFGHFAQVLQKTQEKLHQASDTIDGAFARTRSIERKLRRVEALDDSEAEKLLSEE